MITRRPLNSSRMPALRAGAVAGLAALLLASDLVLLTLFLNPEVTLRGDAWALLTSLLLPWTAIALPGLWLVVAASSALPGWPRAARPPLEALPGVTTATLLAISAAAALFLLSLVSYRHSVPVEVLSPLAGSAVALTAGDPAPAEGAADLDQHLHRPSPPRPWREELRHLSAARVVHGVRAVAEGGARRPSRPSRARVDRAHHVRLPPEPRPLERAQRLRHPGRDRARVGHVSARAHPGLHALALLPPVPARSRARGGRAVPSRPRPRGTRACRRGQGR